MLFDWIAREGGIIVSWWLLITLAGAAVFPLCVRLLGGLPDKGYTLARAAGLLVVGFVFWLLASLGFLKNTPGGIAFAWIIVLAISLVIYFRVGERFDWRAWWAENRRVVIATEIIFAVLMIGWAIVRAHQNGIFATEKPMDLAFMSAVQRSETFPPNDPWMAGYAISYYYFGYLISAMLSMMSGISSTIGFNMNITMLFALTGTTAFGVVYNLVRSRAFVASGEREYDDPTQMRAIVFGVLGLVFVVLLGNFETVFIEIPYNERIASTSYLEWWDVNERQEALPGIEGATVSFTEWPDWWWFRAARALNDRQLNGERQEVIDEFPQFSYLLADNHPHVMSLPFAALALGLALNLLLTWRKPGKLEIVLYSVVIGGLIFLNTWDGPIYLMVLVGADALRRLIRNGSGRLTGSDWLELVVFGVTVLLLAALLYLPFLIGFRSQLAGVLPNLESPTLFRQYFLMFGPFILILVVWLGVEAWRGGRRMNWRMGLQIGLGITLIFAAAMIVLTAVTAIVVSSQVQQAQTAGQPIPPIADEVLSYVENNGGWGAVLPELLSKRLANGLTTVVLTMGLMVVAGRLFPRLRRFRDIEPEEREVVTYPLATGFALLLVGGALVLTLFPEFLYLRDNFGTRMNTVFKFYYEAWLMFSVASAYAVYTLLADVRFAVPVPAVLKPVFGGMVVVVLLAGAIYPVLGIYSRMFTETRRLIAQVPTPLTLDGGTTVTSSADYTAIMCLNQIVSGNDVVVAEAVGSSYHIEQGGRVGALLGIPIVLGWEGHEAQWRGATYGETAGSRAQDMKTLYSDPRWPTTQQIIAKYGIDYIMVGDAERAKYGSIVQEKFDEHLQVVCPLDGKGTSRIYKVEPQVATR